MAVLTAEMPITGDRLFAMGDIGRCELVEGEIIKMSPTGIRHGYIEVELSFRLKDFVRARKLGWVVGGEAGIYTKRNPDTVRGADVAFFSRQRFPAGVPETFTDAVPELVVEVVSPDEKRKELRKKIQEYFAIGVDRVWQVEPRKAMVIVYSSPTEFQELYSSDTLVGEGVLQGFSLNVGTLFADE